MVNLRTIDVLNLAKATSAGLILVLAWSFGLSDLRKAVYTGIHLSYLVWWFIHQWAVPGWGQIVFGKRIEDTKSLTTMIGIFGILYALPAYLAFTNRHPMSPGVAVAAMILHFNGSGLNIGADFYKSAQKQAGVKTVSTHIYDGRLGPHPNHLGDWIRYSAFALASGTLLAWIVPAVVVAVNFATYKERAQQK